MEANVGYLKPKYVKMALGLVFALFIHGRAFAAYTFNWNGSVSTDWNTTLNWTITGLGSGLALYPGSGGRTDDVVQFGVIPLVTYTRQPILSTSVTVASITFGSVQYISGFVLAGTSITGTILTVNGATLTVTGDITQDYNPSTSSTSIFNDIRGTGTVTCANVQFGNTASVTTVSFSFLILEAAAFNVSGNVNMNLNVTKQNGSGIRLEGGTMTLNGRIFFTNRGVTSQNSGYFTVNARTSYKTANTITNPTLVLTNTAAIGGLVTPYSSINFYGDRNPGGKATIRYTGLNPLIYTTATLGFGPGGGVLNGNAATDPIYDNLVIQGTGTAVIGGPASTGNTSYLNVDSTLTTNSNASFANGTNTNTTIGATGGTGASWTNNAAATITGGAGTTDINGTLSNSGTINMGTGALAIARDYTNTGLFSPNAAALITFDGTTQSLTDATPTGTNFYNVTFSGGGTKTMNPGSKFTVAPLYTLNVIASSTLAVGNSVPVPTALTLLSNASGDASIGNLSLGTITGNINVQRYVKGPVRRYMLLSSPVTNTVFGATSVKSYNLVPLKSTTYITGPGGVANGFDDAAATGNSPSVFIYDENAPATTNVNQVAGNEFKPFGTTSEGVPAANGFLYYFRGSRSVTNPFTAPFPAADNATLDFFGTVTKGTGASSAALTTNVINFPNTPPTYYVAAGSGMTAPANLSFHASTPVAKRGFNLVGNPYASVIDLHAVYAANPSNAFYYMLIKDAVTGTNSVSTRYALYDASSGTNGTVQTGASRFALSGQGFFTVASSASALVFNETMKVPYTSYSSAPSSVPVFNVKHGSQVTTLKANTSVATDQQLALSSANNAVSEDPVPRLRMELVKDSTVLNTTDISFKNNASSSFFPGEDAPYLQASGQGDIFYSLTSDSLGCFANYTCGLETIKRINLVVTFSNYGIYTLTAPYKANIDARYRIYLMDKYTSDSLDIVHNTTFNFNVDNNKASYAHDRFYLKIGIVPGSEYRLLRFSGSWLADKINLDWKTDNESSFTKFSLEKSTNGSRSFITIDSVASNGSGSYSYTDNAPGQGQIAYRLVQHLVSGEVKTSETLLFDQTSGKPVKFMVYPSNALNNIHISLGKNYNKSIKIQIISSTGQVVQTLSANNTDNVQQNVAGLLRGLYVVIATDANGNLVGNSKFIKQ
jgi:hypothetical protein